MAANNFLGNLVNQIKSVGQQASKQYAPALQSAQSFANSAGKVGWDIGRAVVRPAEQYGRLLGGGFIQGPVLAATQGRVNIPFLPESDLKKFSGDSFQQRLMNTAPEGARRTVGAMSYALPYGQGGIAMRAGVGALGGAMVAASDKPDTMSNGQYAGRIGIGAGIGSASNVILPMVANAIANRFGWGQRLNLEQMQDAGRGVGQGQALANDTQIANSLHPELGVAQARVLNPTDAIQNASQQASRYINANEANAVALLQQGMEPEQVATQYGAGVLQKASQRMNGLGLLADFDNAKNIGDINLAKTIATTIIRQPSTSVYAGYRNPMAQYIQQALSSQVTPNALQAATSQAAQVVQNNFTQPTIGSMGQSLSGKPPEITQLELAISQHNWPTAYALLRNFPESLNSLKQPYIQLLNQAFHQ